MGSEAHGTVPTRSVSTVTLVVRDYDEAISFFTKALRFCVFEDTPLGEGKRWVVVGPENPTGMAILLAKAVDADQERHIGNQTGGRVSFFLETNDFWNDYRHMQSCGVTFEEAPREESYGTVAIFNDLYGNRWDLIQQK